MGDINQLNFVKQNVQIIHGPILEVGSKDYGNTPDYRSLFPNYKYVGVDMEEGKGVDVLLDLTCDFHEIISKLGEKRFNTVICMSVLEHVSNPFTMCANISKLLNKNGLVIISAPFSWKIHGYPSDYWRFTPQGIKSLFPDFDFDTYAGNLSTNVIGEIEPIHNYMMRAELEIHKGLKRKSYGYLTALFIKFFKRFRIMPQIFRYPYLFPPVIINMIGIKK